MTLTAPGGAVCMKVMRETDTAGLIDGWMDWWMAVGNNIFPWCTYGFGDCFPPSVPLGIQLQNNR